MHYFTNYEKPSLCPFYVDLRLSGTTCSELSTYILHDLHYESSQFLSSSSKLCFASYLCYILLLMKSFQLTILQSIKELDRLLEPRKLRSEME